MICKTFNIGELNNYKYVVVLSKYNGKILLSRHKERTTWETQGGHIESNETPLEAAKRELYEESGVVQFEITPFCDYWAGDVDMVHGAGGMVFLANITVLSSMPESEMEEVKTFEELPDNLTYPAIATVLFEELKQREKQVVVRENKKNVYENCQCEESQYEDSQLIYSEKVELWDAYKEDGSLTGEILVRGKAIPEGLFNAVAEVFVMHRDGTILMMRRDMNKPIYPGFWESGAGGAVLKGESFRMGARRELLEETGIIAGDLELIYTKHHKNSIFKGYLCLTNIAKGAIRLQKGETIDYKWVEPEEFLQIFESDKYITSLRDRMREFVKSHFSTYLR